MLAPKQLVVFLSSLLAAILPCVSGQAAFVRLTKDCFAQNETLEFDFNNEINPRDDDWIGIYHVRDLSPNNDPLLWVYSCGRQDCFRATTRGRVEFTYAEHHLERFWPLPRGTYQAVLSREANDDDEPYLFLDASNTFRVEQDQQDCQRRNRNPGIPIMTQAPTPTRPPTIAPANIAPTTPEPTNGPTTPQPTNRPTTPFPTISPASPRMSQVIQSAKQDILTLIHDNRFLPGQYLRQVFHDCVGGRCDGCINTDNIDNHGLNQAMRSIRTIERQYRDDLSRADLWVLASFVAVEHTMPADGDKIEFPFHYYGREDCSEPMDQGPDPVLCSPNKGTQEVLDYLKQEFDFDEREVAAIMGSHTIGAARRTILGFNGINGWVPNNTRFDNQYYEELVGPGTRFRDQFEGAPQWRLAAVNNTDIGLPNRWQWEGFPGGVRVMMLNSDIALVRELNDDNKREDGFVTCKFVTRAPGNTVCPVARESLFSHMVRFRNDNMAFLQEFRDAMIKMTNVGYDIDQSSCDDDGNCRLVPKSNSTTNSTPTTTATTTNPPGAANPLDQMGGTNLLEDTNTNQNPGMGNPAIGNPIMGRANGRGNGRE